MGTWGGNSSFPLTNASLPRRARSRMRYRSERFRPPREGFLRRFISSFVDLEVMDRVWGVRRIKDSSGQGSGEWGEFGFLGWGRWKHDWRR
ncbi:hypothetical protein K443DRAFT_467173 [Laccaria amethystina LaAM-08-1]|uniref:Uncharacterized protein n=1 Tax=Laccaria amethystina LaAM-08-1 TaxID=1095629 RepID=A0A0C9X2L3_9AGAR|nr:hypothetical protein K443DRAFT_467173 [Laccaria amethystina LaAM-08-1]